jgi:hypothetical protein
MSTAGSDFNRANERLRRPAPPFLCARRAERASTARFRPDFRSGRTLDGLSARPPRPAAAHRLDAGIDGVIINMPTNIQGNRPEAARRR